MLQRNIYPQATLSVPPTVPPCRPSSTPRAPPPRVDPPERNPPHRYPLRSRAQSNHTVETVGEGAVAFQGLLDPNTGKTHGYMQLIRRPDKSTWTTVLFNGIGRLSQGVGNRIKGKNTIFFIHHSGVPAGKRVTYGRIVASISPNKTETHQVRITVGGDKLS